MIFNFLRKHIKTTTALVACVIVGATLLVGAPPFWAILSTLLLASLYFVLIARSANKTIPLSQMPLNTHGGGEPVKFASRPRSTFSYENNYSPSIPSYFSPELRSLEQEHHAKTAHLVSTHNRKIAEDKAKVEALVTQNKESNQNVTRVINNQEDKNAATYAKNQLAIKSEMENNIKQKKEEHLKSLETFSGTPQEKAELIQKHEQEINNITKDYEKILSENQANYESLASMIKSMRTRNGF